LIVGIGLDDFLLYDLCRLAGAIIGFQELPQKRKMGEAAFIPEAATDYA